MSRRPSWSTVIVLAVLTVCCSPVPGWSGTAYPPWAAATPAPPSDQPGQPGALTVMRTVMRTVVVTARGVPDLSVGRDRGRSARLAAVRTELKANASSSQQGLWAEIERWRRTDEVGSAQQLWISNGIRLTATPRVIAEIAARADVVSVRSDRIDLVPDLAPASANQAMIGAPSVWADGRTGQGTVVAVLDSGVDVTHPDLAPGFRGGANSWFDPYGQRSSPMDLGGHGTAVAGVIVGRDSSGQTLGTAPGAQWIAARVFNDAGASTISAVHEAFQWTLDPDGDPGTPDAPDVVNASWSIGAAPGCDLAFQPDIQALRAAGVLTVASAGNFGPGTTSSVSPGNYPESLSVGAVDDASVVVPSSGRGPASCGGRARPFPDVVAPGVDVATTDRFGLFQTASGTSVAAPHVSGLAALLRSGQHTLTVAGLEQAIVGTAHDLGPTGVDNTYGAGRVDAAAAYASVAPAPSFAVSVSPAAAIVRAGGDATFGVMITPYDGFAADVALSAAGLPATVATPSFAPSVVTGGAGTSLLTVTTDPAAHGSHPFTIEATSGSKTQHSAVVLTVGVATPTPSPAPTPTPTQTPTPGPLPTPAPAPSPAPSPTQSASPAQGHELLLSTRSGRVPGTSSRDEVYSWTGSSYSRVADLRAWGLPASASVDGLDWVDERHVYLSFSDPRTRVPGVGPVGDEDVVRFDGRRWRLWFDGSRHGLEGPGADLDAISVAGASLFFSTRGSVRISEVGGRPDDADIYRWRRGAFSRVFDASAAGLAETADVDGLSRRGRTRTYVSFAGERTRLPRVGTVRDEDIVLFRTRRLFTTYFDGSRHGLGGASGLDVDAFDLRRRTQPEFREPRD